MNELWSKKEINYCVRAYLWMMECEQAGEKVKNKKKVEQALIVGPLYQRGRLDGRMANISFLMREPGHDLLTGFKPHENVGQRAIPIIEKAKLELNGRPKGNKEPKKRTTTFEQYERDQKVLAHAEKRANGICELSNQPAPFIKEDSSPFLEAHHIIPLSEGGVDGIKNVALLSPNCLREARYGNR